MSSGNLGRNYNEGDIIIREGEKGDTMYVIQTGSVEIYQTRDDVDIHLNYLNEGDFFGEMAIFDKPIRSASVRAVKNTRVLTIDKKNFLRRIHEDSSLAFNIIQNLSQRLRELDTHYARVTASDRRNWQTRLAKQDKK